MWQERTFPVQWGNTAWNLSPVFFAFIVISKSRQRKSDECSERNLTFNINRANRRQLSREVQPFECLDPRRTVSPELAG